MSRRMRPPGRPSVDLRGRRGLPAVRSHGAQQRLDGERSPRQEEGPRPSSHSFVAGRKAGGGESTPPPGPRCNPELSKSLRMHLV